MAFAAIAAGGLNAAKAAGSMFYKTSGQATAARAAGGDVAQHISQYGAEPGGLTRFGQVAAFGAGAEAKKQGEKAHKKRGSVR